MVDQKNESYQEAVEHLYDMVEPVCGFRPDSEAQAISLVVSAFKELEPAMDALQNLALEMDALRGEATGAD